MNPPLPPTVHPLPRGALTSLRVMERERVWIETHFLWSDTKEVGMVMASLRDHGCAWQGATIPDGGTRTDVHFFVEG